MANAVFLLFPADNSYYDTAQTAKDFAFFRLQNGDFCAIIKKECSGMHSDMLVVMQQGSEKT